MPNGPVPDHGMPDLTFPGASARWPDAGDTMADLMNWTRQMSNNMETANSLDIVPNGEIADPGFMLTPTSENNWQGIRWHGVV